MLLARTLLDASLLTPIRFALRVSWTMPSLPPPPKWVPWGLAIVLLASVAFWVVLWIATQTSDMGLRDTLGMIHIYGFYFIVAPAFLAICLVGIGVRLWRHFRS
jgi:hypothetical protein